MTTRHPRIIAVLLAPLLAAVLGVLGGCSSDYVLRGTAIQGPMTGAEIVTAGDERLSAPGVGGARIRLLRDPGLPKETVAATGTTSSDGTFELPVSGFGAGWMDEQWMIEILRSGYQSGRQLIRLPSSKQRLLVILARGQSMPLPQREDLLETVERYR